MLNLIYLLKYNSLAKQRDVMQMVTSTFCVDVHNSGINI